jgi:hypothetical protein
VIYPDTTLDTWTDPDNVTHKLSEIVLAYEQHAIWVAAPGAAATHLSS